MNDMVWTVDTTGTIDTTGTVALLEHSPLGASSAERWMACPGSVTLISALKSSPDYVEDDPDYRRDGTQAHALAAHCLEKDIDAWQRDEEQFPELTADMLGAVQEYLDYVRSIEGAREVEVRVHLPEFHPQFFGTLDCVVFGADGTLHIIDYKHGVGVVVDADHNPQLEYYGYGKFGPAGLGRWRDETPVKLTIVQPRAFHPDGIIRTWETTVGEIRRWAEEELRPAMEATSGAEYLDMGPHCRFCPAKLVCPAFDGLARRALAGVRVSYDEAQQLKMLIKAVEEKAYADLISGKTPEEVGAKLVNKRSVRVWKEDGATKLPLAFGDDAWKPKELRSPAEVEKLPRGKEYVAEFAFMPENGYTVASLSDKKAAVKVKTLDEKYGDPAQYALT
jgi:hypothetical protein